MDMQLNRLLQFFCYWKEQAFMDLLPMLLDDGNRGIDQPYGVPSCVLFCMGARTLSELVGEVFRGSTSSHPLEGGRVSLVCKGTKGTG